MDRKADTAGGIAREMQGQEYPPTRLAEIAIEAAVLNDAVRAAARKRLAFDDEPASFAAELARLKP
ncbi:MAG: hypothetical protein FJX02_12375 [Alphaproteobacteria bacterium]|nr:hypothetical protein [Alphaproteobacteria bacterium]